MGTGITALLTAALMGEGFTGAAGGTMNFRIQAELGVVVAIPAAERFGGLELHGTVGAFGFGIAAGLGWERERIGEETVDGGYFMATIEVRPLTWIGEDLSRYVDLHIGLGGHLGSLGDDFRGALLTTVGLDVALYPEPVHPALFIEYRLASPHSPEGLPDHFLVVGLTFRVAQ